MSEVATFLAHAVALEAGSRVAELLIADVELESTGKHVRDS